MRFEATIEVDLLGAYITYKMQGSLVCRFLALLLTRVRGDGQEQTKTRARTIEAWQTMIWSSSD
jgi:hypothetical protein